LAISTKPLSPHLGLEVTGVDLEQPLSAGDQQAIREAWIQAGVLLFRGACRSPEAQLRLSRLFGELEASATDSLNLKNNPYLMALVRDPSKPKHNTGRFEVGGEERIGVIPWHWDQSYTPKIVRGAALRMVEPAARGGETGFIDGIAAYDRLSPEMKARVEGLEVVYRFASEADPSSRNGLGYPNGYRLLEPPPVTDELRRYLAFPPSVHPLVITQRETGRKVLKFSPLHSQYILGLPPEESRQLMRELAEHLTDERYAYFHRYGRDDLVVWDNWRIIHSALGVPPECGRRAERTTIVGDYGYGRYLDAESAKGAPQASYMD
jgi:taurine dioxygenase